MTRWIPRLAVLLALTLALGIAGAVVVHRSRAPRTRRVSIEVAGMTCAACTKKVSAQLAAVPGVHATTVDLRSHRARVTCDASIADTALTAAIRRAGPEYIGLVLDR